MNRKIKLLLATALASAMLAGTALADFTPGFELKVSNTKVSQNPKLDIHLEFDEEDEEIGNFKMTLPKGYNIAADDDIPNNEEIGSGTITIRGGVDCRPGPEGAIPLGANVTVPATIYEKERTDEEIDSAVHAVWLLDLEPLNRVRLLVKGSITSGWTIEGAPTPSDNTCNPLTVDLTINDKSESGVGLVTNPVKKGKKIIVAEIFSQDSPSIARFEQVVKITKK